MPLAWNEIRQRAITFSRSWSRASRERAESQTFWNEFFEVFGIRRRLVASFEEPVKNLKGAYEFIDLFWPGKLVAEHKSRGKDLSKASTQANGYILNLLNDGRGEQAPRYILVSDFARFALHDLEAESAAEQTLEFSLADFHRHIRSFAFIAGYEARRLDPEDDANLKATALLANVHDRLEDVGYKGHDLQRFMVRILFCLFADDTGIYDPDIFRLFLHNQTRADGSDVGTQLSFLFRILDTPDGNRPSNLDDDLASFPYVDGELYHERLDFPVFDAAMRIALLACCDFHWEKISPAVFGSLFQSVMDDRERRQIGAHYTSERDILKLIRSLFLDDLREEFDAIRHDQKKLEVFHTRLGKLKLLDPACGCGNFLVLAYRELRRLEMDVLVARFGGKPEEINLWPEGRVDVTQLYGIEIEEWPARIAEVALWLMDHQMNQELFARFGRTRATLPLGRSPNVRVANALRLDWNELLPAGECSYILGNPPFVGAKFQTEQQRGDMQTVSRGVDNAGLLDYVCGWYLKAAEYLRTTSAACAFVSTNSIAQGEQVGTLWPHLFSRGIKIHFGHRTFAWASEAKGKAHVHVVIIGFGHTNPPKKRIYDYDFDQAKSTITVARNISPYLIAGSDNAVSNRSQPLCNVPKIGIGNKPIDDGNYLFTTEEKDAFIKIEPAAAEFFREWYGSDELINGYNRWCLWLGDCPPALLHRMPECLKRVEAVRKFRLKSKSKPTIALAKMPKRFHVENMPPGTFLVVPKVSSEKRAYIPIAFMALPALVSDLVFVVPNATLYHFGILSSAMHMAWVRQVCGRLESRYRYSSKLVYNNYPWPEEFTDKQKQRVEECAKAVLDARLEFPGSTLADLYDPLTMPHALAIAHQKLDTAVDRCYRSQPFAADFQRFEYLFALYEKLRSPLTAGLKTSRKRKSS